MFANLDGLLDQVWTFFNPNPFETLFADKVVLKLQFFWLGFATNKNLDEQDMKMQSARLFDGFLSLQDGFLGK